jgi:hypothetical protein
MAEACYVPQYRTASFKGVTFEATEASSEHGRRGAEGQFPFSERTAYADLGRKIRVYKLRARFARNTHIADASRLIAACESPGPGILVHPTRGPVRAACRVIDVRDDIFEDAGLTWAELEFVEANEWILGALGAALTGVSIGAVSAAIGTVFRAAWSVVDAVAFFERTLATGPAGKATSEIRRQVIGAAGITENRDLWRVANELHSVSGSPAALADPARMWPALAGGAQAIDSFGKGPGERWQAHRGLANWAGRLPPAPGAARVPVEGLASAMRSLAAVHLTRLALERQGATLAAALTEHDTVMALLDDELEAARLACNDGLWLALTAFKTDAQQALLSRAYTLPPLIRCNAGRGLTAMGAAWEVYGDATRADMIEANNRGAWLWAMGPVIVAPKV